MEWHVTITPSDHGQINNTVYLLHFNSSLQEFDDHRDADDAVYDMNGKDLFGER